MSIITERPPTSAVICGERVAAATDFRTGISFEVMVSGGETDISRLVRLWFPDDSGEVAAALGAALWLYRCGREERGGGSPGGGCIYDFEQDADALLASFSSAYGIDLSRDSLHWWTFRKLMLGLPESSAFMRILHYRAADVSGMEPARRRSYERLKRLYALKTPARGAVQALPERDSAWRGYIERRFAERGMGGGGNGA